MKTLRFNLTRPTARAEAKDLFRRAMRGELPDVSSMDTLTALYELCVEAGVEAHLVRQEKTKDVNYDWNEFSIVIKRRMSPFPVEAEDSSAWSSETPTVAGRYWFYGHRDKEFCVKNNRPRELMVCLVRWSGSSDRRFRMIVADGGFLYEQQIEGLWHPMTVPTLPEDPSAEVPQQPADQSG